MPTGTYLSESEEKKDNFEDSDNGHESITWTIKLTKQ